MSHALLMSLVLMVGCYAPDLSRVRFACNPASPLCPDGLVCLPAGCCAACSGGFCGSCADVPTPTADMSGARDMVGTTADMVPSFVWDPMQPAGPAAGCASNLGWRLGSDKLWACPGNYNYPTWGQQCSAGYAAPATLTIPESACASVPWGFFVSFAHGLDRQKTPTANERADWNAPDATWSVAYRHGCGRVGQVWNNGTGARVYTFTAVNKVGGFPIAALCTGQVAQSNETPWVCDPTQYPYRESEYPRQTALALATDGVLCAAP